MGSGAEASGAGAFVGEPGDAELISSVRNGDLQAYGILFERHVGAATRLARQLVSSGDVDDLVSEAFAKVMVVLQNGGGPDLAFRAYLLTAIRRLHVDRIRSTARLHSTDDFTPYDRGVPFEDTAVAGFENAAAARAFASLPERWQQVLWHTEVEGQKPAEIAPLLGMSANSVSALAYRAREGLREAFVSMHAQDAPEDDCALARANLGAYIRGGSSRRDSQKVRTHLDGCRPCTAIYLELVEVNANMGAILAPLLLGSAGAGYLSASGAGTLVAAKGGVVLLAERLKEWGSQTGGKIALGTAAAVAVTVALTAALQHSPTSPPTPSAGPLSTSTATVSPDAEPAPAPPGATPQIPASPSSPSSPSSSAVPGVASPVSARPTRSPAPARVAQQSPVIAVPLGVIELTPGQRSVTIDLTRGAKDPDGDPLRVVSAEVISGGPHSTIMVGADAARVSTLARRATDSRTITYIPILSWRGTETIGYVLSDGRGGTVAGRLRVRTPNTAPTARPDRFELQARPVPGPAVALPVLANDVDLNGDRLRLTAVRAVAAPAPGSGTITLAGGVLRYTAAAWTPGRTADRRDTFEYTITDGHGGTARGLVTVVVSTTPNNAPTAVPVEVSTHWSETVTLTPVIGDADGDALTLSADPPQHGTVRVAQGQLHYTPTGTYVGDDTFRYTVRDGIGSATATATVHLTNAHPVTAQVDVLTVEDGQDATVSVPDTDPDGDTLTISQVSGATLSGRTLNWSSPFGQDSTHTISYTLSDGASSATRTVTVRARMPVAELILSSAHPNAGSAQENFHFRLNGLPAGRTATVTIVLTGATHLAQRSAENGNVCTIPAVVASPMTITCTVSTSTDFLHLDLDHTTPWSLEATAHAENFHAEPATMTRP